MKRTTLFAAAALFAVSVEANAQSRARLFLDDWTNAGKDMVSVLASPFDASRHDWVTTAAVFGVFGASMFLDKGVADWAQQSDSSLLLRGISPVRHGGFLYKGKYVVPPLLGVYAYGVIAKNDNARDFVTGCIASWGSIHVVRRVVDYGIGRARPDTMPDNPQNWRAPNTPATWMMNSFPAGHFANVMGCASYWNSRFDLGFAGPLVYGLAGAVGVGRIADRGHWFSDTVIGGILGYAVGREIGRRSLQRHLDNSASANQLRTSEFFLSPDAGGLVAGMRFTF